MLKIGWSIKDVSTDKPVCIPGQMHMRISQGVLDSMTVTALTIADDKDYAIFLCCDLVGVEGGILDAIRERISRKNPQIDPLKVIMHVTHSHCGPHISMSDGFGRWGEVGEVPMGGMEVTSPTEYREFFLDSAADAIGGHHNTGVFANILMEPPPDNGAGHSATGEYDAQTPQGKANINMYNVAGAFIFLTS